MNLVSAGIMPDDARSFLTEISAAKGDGWEKVSHQSYRRKMQGGKLTLVASPGGIVRKLRLRPLVRCFCGDGALTGTVGFLARRELQPKAFKVLCSDLKPWNRILELQTLSFKPATATTGWEEYRLGKALQ
jgi:hypothetical protein